MPIDPTSFAFGLLIGGATIGLVWFLAVYVKRHAN
jgi:hypothetical protein